MNYLKQIWNSILALDNKKFEDEIFVLQGLIKERNDIIKQWSIQHEADRDYIKKTNQKNIDLEVQVLDLEYDLKTITSKYENSNKHASLEVFKKWLKNNTKPVKRYYGNVGKFRPSSKLRYSDKEKEMCWDIIDNMMKFKHATINHKTADELLYLFKLKFNKKFPSRTYYILDKDLYKISDFWAPIKITYKQIKSGKIGDCDDFMILEHGMIKELMLKYYPKEADRIRGVFLKIRNSGYHAALTWLRGDDVNDFVPIETTYMDFKFVEDWERKYTLLNNQFYEIIYTFDQKHEYVKY